MSRVWIGFRPSTIYGNDNVFIETANKSLVNCYYSLYQTLNESFSIKKRFGIKKLYELPFVINGLYWNTSTRELIIISGADIYASNGGFANPVLIYSGGDVTYSNRWSFAETPYGGLIMANGGRLLVYNNGYINEVQGEEFSQVSYVAYLDGRIIFNDNRTTPFDYRQLVRMSDIIDVTNSITYTEGIYFEELTKPDVITYIGVSNRILRIFGTDTITSWHYQGLGEFERIDAMTMDSGCIAPRTISNYQGVWIYLTTEKNIVMFTDSGERQIISTPAISDEIRQMTYIIDAVGSIVNIDGRVLYIITFPYHKKTFCYDVVTKSWSRFTSGVNNDEFVSKFSIYVPYLMANICACKGGIVGMYNETYYQDLDDSVCMEVTTGKITHGRLTRKRSRDLRVYYSTNYNGKLDIIYRDYDNNNEKTTKKNYELPFNKNSILIKPNGMYRSREITLRHTDATSLTLLGMEETVENIE